MSVPGLLEQTLQSKDKKNVLFCGYTIYGPNVSLSTLLEEENHS